MIGYRARVTDDPCTTLAQLPPSPISALWPPPPRERARLERCARRRRKLGTRPATCTHVNHEHELLVFELQYLYPNYHYGIRMTSIRITTMIVASIPGPPAGRAGKWRALVDTVTSARVRASRFRVNALRMRCQSAVVCIGVSALFVPHVSRVVCATHTAPHVEIPAVAAVATWPAVREAVSICSVAAEELTVRLAEGFRVDSYDGQSVLIDGDYCKRPAAILGGTHRRIVLVGNRTGTATCLAAQGFGCGSFFTLQNHAIVRIANFSLVGGFSPPGGWDGYGGAIWVEQSTLLLSHSRIMDGVAWRGGGIYSRWSNLTISAVSFVNNSAIPSNNGGAISADWCSLRIMDAVFDGNRAAGLGAALSVSSSGQTTIVATRFEDNNCGANVGCAIAQSGYGLVRCLDCVCVGGHHRRAWEFTGNVTAGGASCSAQ